MSESEKVGPLIWNTSPQIYNALKQSNASDETLRFTAVAAKLYNQHLQFTELPIGVARQEFSKLPLDNQQDLIDYMVTEQPYSRAKTNAWQTWKDQAGRNFSGLFNMFDKAYRTQTNWYRANNLRKYQESIDPEFQAQNQATVERARQAPTISSAFLARRELDLRLFSRDQWDTTFEGEQYFDAEKERDVSLKYSPGVSRVAKLYSMQKLPQEIMALLKTPEEYEAFMAYNDPEKGKESEVFQAIIDFDNAKVSPGRDLAYGLRAYDKKSKIPDRYDIVSGLTDAAFSVYTDPTIIGTKIFTVVRAMRFGLLGLAGKNGVELSQGLDKMFRATSVQSFWNDAGSKIDKYSKSKNLADRGQIARDLAKDFGIDITRRISDDATKITAVDFINELAKAGVKDSDSALRYFKDAGVTDLIMAGRTASAVEPLMPRKTIISSMGSNLRNTTATLMGLRTAREVPKEWNTATALSKNFATQEDFSNYRSFAGAINKQISKVASGKPIPLDTAEGAEDVFRLARLIVDPYFANVVKQAWREGDEASRLMLFDGIALNIGRKFGLSDDQVKELYGRTGRQLYSEDMSTFSRNSSLLGKAGNLGRRTGLTEKQLASTAALTKGALADLSRQRKDATASKRELSQRLKELKASNASQSELDVLQNELDNLGKKIGGLTNKIKMYRNATGDSAVNDIRKAMANSGISKPEIDEYIAILRKGVTEDVDSYQFQQILGTVYDSVFNDPALAKKLSTSKDGIDVVDWDLVNDFVVKAFPDAEEVSKTIGRVNENPAQLGDAQYAIGKWHLDNAVNVPNFVEWSRKANSAFIGSSRFYGEILVNGWSWLTLIPRLGIRSAIEELGLFGITVPFGDLGKLILAKKISTEYRYAKYGANLKSLGFINYTLAKFFRTGEAKISDAQRKLLRQNPELLPEVIAKNVARSKAAFISGFDTKTIERWVDDWFSSPYGFAALDEINEGALRALNLGESAVEEVAVNMQKAYGPIAEWNLNVKEALTNLKATGQFDNIRRTDYGFDVSWLNAIQMRLDPKTNMGWGKIVLANIYNQEKAITALVKNYEKYPELMNKFVLYKSLGPEEFARRQFQFIAHPFMKYNGLINDALVNKVRKTVIDPETGKTRLDIDASNLTYKDLDEFDKLSRPETVIGMRYVPVDSLGDITSWLKNVKNGGMALMGKQISILGREPALFANYQIYRQRLMTAEADMAKRYVDQGLDEVTANLTASKWAGNIAQDLATTRTLQYVDNPAIRTNFAFNMRNFARYYRATEDFYRRVGRAVRFDPLSIAKFRLALTGLEHTGFIHKDENGELYFVYPGDEIIYSAVGMGMRLTRNENALKLPQPAQFTGRVSMLTPSLDPEAAIPTLSGPVAAISISFIERWLPESEQMSFRKRLLGKYSVNRTLPELLLPTTVSRIYNGFFNNDERASQYASAVRKAHMYYAANGIMKEFIEKEMAGGEEWSAAFLKYSNYVEATARNVTVVRNTFGLVAPASPQVDFGLDVPEWVREQSNITQLKPQFQELIRQYGNDPQAADKALYRFTTLYPGKSVYALTESEKTGIGTVAASKEAVDWIRANPGLSKKYPEAIRFIIPSNGKYDLEAYAFLQDQGFTEMKTIEKFAYEAVVAEDYFYWRQVKNFQDERIANTPNTAEKRAFQSQWEAWSRQYREQNPHVQVYLDSIVRNDQAKKNVISELANMNRKGDVPDTESNRKIIQMVDLYNQFSSNITSVTGRTDEEVSYRKNLRRTTLEYMLEIAQNDSQALAAYRTLFDPLIGE